MKEIPLPVNELKNALIGLGKIIGRHNHLPVLNYVQVERTKSSSITLTANNLDQAAVCSLDSDGRGETCIILVPLKDLSEIVKRCGKNDTILIQSEEKASVPSGNIKYPVGATMAEHRFEFIPADDFPPIPQIGGDPVPVPDSLRRSLMEAFQCASTDETRLILNGAYIDVSKPACHQVVGTNGRILYASNSFSLPLEKSLMLPTNKFLGWKPFSEDGQWSIRVGEQKGEDLPPFQISSLRWRYLSRQIEGNYPNYRQVIPTDYARTIIFQQDGAEELVNTIERMPCHDAVNKTMGLQMKGGRVYLLGKSSGDQPWSCFEITGAKAQGRDLLMAMNREYVLKAITFGLTTVRLIDERSPAVFVNGGRQMVIMPVRPDAGPAHQSRAEPVQEPTEQAEAEPVVSHTEEEQSAEASIPEAEAQPEERNQQMQSTPVPASNGITAEPPPTISAALEQIETIRGSYRQAIQGLNALTDTLKAVQREKKATEKEVQSVRTTLERLQSVRL